jgi:hypothetical protein
MHRSVTALRLAATLPFLGLLTALGGACASTPRGGAAATVVPADATWALHAPDLRRLRDGLLGFTGGVEGGAGALDLVAERFGLDLRSDEALARAGIDADGSLAVFGVEGGLGLSVSVRDPGSFRSNAAERAERMAAARTDAARTSPEDDGPATTLRFVLPGESGARLAAGVTQQLVGLVVVDTAPESRTVDLWQRLAELPPAESLATAPRLAEARTAARETPTIEVLLDGRVLSEALGAGPLVDTTLANLAPWRGGITLDSGRVALRLAAPLAEGGSLPSSWLAGAPADPPLASFVPRNALAFVRASVNLAKLRAIPGFLRERLIPSRLLGLEDAPIPDVGPLIEVLGDELGVAVLGLAPSASLGALTTVTQDLQRWPSLGRVALVVRLRDRARLKAMMTEIASVSAPAAGWSVSPVPAPARSAKAFDGWTFVRPAHSATEGEAASARPEPESHAVILDGDVGLLVIGAVELEGLLAVRAGKALSLVASVEGEAPLAADVLATRADAPTRSEVGLQLGFLRLSRELADRGAPPYFVKLLDSVHAISAGLGVKSDGARLDLELRL